MNRWETELKRDEQEDGGSVCFGRRLIVVVVVVVVSSSGSELAGGSRATEYGWRKRSGFMTAPLADGSDTLQHNPIRLNPSQLNPIQLNWRERAENCLDLIHRFASRPTTRQQQQQQQQKNFAVGSAAVAVWALFILQLFRLENRPLDSNSWPMAP